MDSNDSRLTGETLLDQLTKESFHFRLLVALPSLEIYFCPPDITMMSKPILHKLFIILTGSKYRFTPKITSCSLRPTDPLLNNWFKVQPINMKPFRANEKVGPLVQDLDSVLKGTTYLLSQKWVRVNSILYPMSLAIHSVLSLKWEAY
ncbi:hypothetical protein E5676_scaffold287G00880 [Cucumis melo var. makuwa]|uniref:Uncharacterized protein n=1 Tax=Cucumis melo var. makuwa TaxID=1194695 RepID=A0A5D3C4I3_CUCMM|nr:hypothetical protein E5676_scaffold287G00880 [Cucumis melo var. makuwa]